MIDPQSKGGPNKVTPAREHAPAGAANRSIEASGGQVVDPGGVAQTPSMSRQPHPPRSAGQPRPDHAPGGAVSD